MMGEGVEFVVGQRMPPRRAGERLATASVVVFTTEQRAVPGRRPSGTQLHALAGAAEAAEPIR
jgi:hypothetical protein